MAGWLVRPLPPGSDRALIGMVQPAQDRASAHHPSRLRPGHPWCGAGIGEPLVQALVRPRDVEVRYVLPQHVPQVGLAQDQDVVETFAAGRADEPLAGRVLLGCTMGRAQLHDTAR